MPYSRIVATCGTSALQPNNVAGPWLRTQESPHWRWLGDRMTVTAGADEAIGPVLRASAPHVPDATRVSAEYSMLAALRAQRKLAPSPTVVLVHTATPDGALAATVVRHLIERDFGARVQLRSVELDAGVQKTLRRNLGSFMHVVAQALREGDRWSTCFAPLGGYKVMTSLGYLAGAFLQYPTAYLHEVGQILHEIPWVPLRIDETQLRSAASAVRKAAATTTVAALDEPERRAVDDYPWLFERTGDGAEDLVDINAFGLFLRTEAAYRPIIGPRIRGARSVETLLHREDLRVFIQDNVDTLLRLLEAPVNNRGELHHEVSFGHRDAVFGLYKGVSGRQGVFRAAYRWAPAEDRLDLRRVWLEHDAYEAAAKPGTCFYGDEDAWEELSERLFRAP